MNSKTSSKVMGMKKKTKEEDGNWETKVMNYPSVQD